MSIKSTYSNVVSEVFLGLPVFESKIHIPEIILFLNTKK